MLGFLFYEALATRNDDLFIQVYNGSPYLSYRKRIKSLYRPNFNIPKTAFLRLSTSDPTLKTRVFRLSQGREEGKSESLLQQPLVHRLLCILCSDFVRPLSMGTLISELYPDEYFNPNSSPQKLGQTLSRLRQWLHDHSIPLEILVENESYKLIATTPYTIRVERHRKLHNKNELLFEKIFNAFETKPFAVKDVVEQFGFSIRSAQRLLAWGIKRRKITQIAKGASSKYRFLKTSEFKSAAS